MELRKVITELRVKKNLTQAFLADKLGIDPAQMSRIEKGTREIKVADLVKIARAFNISMVDLVGYPDKYVKIDPSGGASKKKLLIEVELSDEDFQRLGISDKIQRVIEPK